MKNILFLLFLILISQYGIAKEAKETRIKIGIIDSGISYAQASGKYLCKGGLKTTILFDNGIDDHGHGENVFGLISNQINPETHCIISYKFWETGISADSTEVNVANSLFQARKDGVKYVNMSLSGPGRNSKEFKQISLGIKENITYIIAAGNNNHNLDERCVFFPACYKKNLKNSE